MAGTQDKKQQIAEDLAKARMQVHDFLLLLRRDLDVRLRIVQSIQHYPWEWVTTGFMCGWLLSRLPARKKKIYVYSEDQEQVKRDRGKTLSKVRALAWSTSKPLIAAYIAKKVAEKIKTHTARTEAD
ncbi:MAG TPA: hypothetical protein VGY91_08680 [Chthoniobacterales bacterium]|jgi:hypothetical protein|nr:hypothetical protein [Chthoniobacterales bacterium]